MVSGKLQNETGKEIYEKGKWIAFPNPEYLSYNRETCLYLKIKEGFDEDKSVRESGKIYLKAEWESPVSFSILYFEIFFSLSKFVSLIANALFRFIPPLPHNFVL